MVDIYSAIYHSPNSSHSDLMDYFEEMLHATVDPAKRNVIMGDLNTNVNANAVYSDRLERLCETFSL